jgi:hypothetical protein
MNTILHKNENTRFLQYMKMSPRQIGSALLSCILRKNSNKFGTRHSIYVTWHPIVEVSLASELEKLALFMQNGIFWDVTPCGSCKN